MMLKHYCVLLFFVVGLLWCIHVSHNTRQCWSIKLTDFSENPSLTASTQLTEKQNALHTTATVERGQKDWIWKYSFFSLCHLMVSFRHNLWMKWNSYYCCCFMQTEPKKLLSFLGLIMKQQRKAGLPFLWAKPDTDWPWKPWPYQTELKVLVHSQSGHLRVWYCKVQGAHLGAVWKHLMTVEQYCVMLDSTKVWNCSHIWPVNVKWAWDL